MTQNSKWIFLCGAVFLLCVFEALSLAAIKLPSTESAIVLGILILFVGHRVFNQAVHACVQKKIGSVPLFITVAVLAGYIIGDRYEAMIVMLLCGLADRLDVYSGGGEKNALDELLEKLPKYAYLKGMDEPIDVGSIHIGQEIVVKPNHVVPLDGEVISGHSLVDEVVITGEQQLVEKGPGSRIFAATSNGPGILYVRILRPLNESVLGQMHTHATGFLQNKKRQLRLEERAIGYYVPIVLISSLAAALLQLLNGFPAVTAFSNSLRFLLVSCPSVVILSGSLATFFASIRAESFGLRINACREFEALADVKAIVFTNPERSVLLPLLKKIGIAGSLLTGLQGGVQGFKAVKTGLLPADKVKEYDRFTKKYGKTALVGEGVCDIPVLASASVSVSVGASFENTKNIASVSLLDARLSELPNCIKLARHAVSISHLNAVVALLFKIGAIGLFLFGAISFPALFLFDLVAALLIGANCARLRR